MKNLNILLKNVRITYKKYTKYTKKQPKTTQIKNFNFYNKTRFSILSLGTKTIIFQKQGPQRNVTKSGQPNYKYITTLKFHP